MRAATAATDSSGPIHTRPDCPRPIPSPPERPELPAERFSDDPHLRQRHHRHCVVVGEHAERTRQVQRQVNVLNRAYSGDRAFDGVDTPFRSRLEPVRFVGNAKWATMGYGSPAERQAKSELRQGGRTRSTCTRRISVMTYSAGQRSRSRTPRSLKQDGVVCCSTQCPAATPLRTTRATPELTKWATGSGCTTPSRAAVRRRTTSSTTPPQRSRQRSAAPRDATRAEPSG